MNVNSECIKLSVKNTPEEAFEEYKRHKEAIIIVTADKYKNIFLARFTMRCSTGKWKLQTNYER